MYINTCVCVCYLPSCMCDVRPHPSDAVWKAGCERTYDDSPGRRCMDDRIVRGCLIFQTKAVFKLCHVNVGLHRIRSVALHYARHESTSRANYPVSRWLCYGIYLTLHRYLTPFRKSIDVHTLVCQCRNNVFKSHDHFERQLARELPRRVRFAESGDVRIDVAMSILFSVREKRVDF